MYYENNWVFWERLTKFVTIPKNIQIKYAYKVADEQSHTNKMENVNTQIFPEKYDILQNFWIFFFESQSRCQEA